MAAKAFAVAGVIMLMVSLGSCATAPTVTQQAVGVLLLLIAVLCLGVAAILAQLEQLRATVLRQAYEVGQALARFLAGRD